MIKLALFNPAALVHGAEGTTKLQRGLEHIADVVDFIPNLLTKGTAHLVAPVAKQPSNLLKTMLMGGKQHSGPLAGTRLRPLLGKGSVVPISEERFKQVSSGAEKGLVHRLNGAPVERKTSVGGLMGIARKHPVMAGLTGAALVSDNPIIDTLNPMFPAQMVGEKLKLENAPTEELTRQLSNDPAVGNNILATRGGQNLADRFGWNTLSKRKYVEQPTETAPA